MSSLLLPIVVESCQSGRRGRRRSSVNQLGALIPAPNAEYFPPQEGSAIVDEHEHPGTASSPVPSSTIVLSPTKTILQLPELPSKLVSAQHCHAVDADKPSSPSTTILGGRRLSTTTLANNVDLRLERLRWRLASGFFAYFLCGWGDGVTGTMLPYLMADYRISYMTSSSLYAASTIGFMLGTLLVETIVHRLGFFDLEKTHWSWTPSSDSFCRFAPGKSEKQKTGYSPSQGRLLALLLASTLHAMFFVMMGTEAGFWVSFGAYAVAAFARSILTASLNTYFSSGPRGSIGYAFALWSFGGVISPLVCQSAVAAGVPWPNFYFGSLVLSTTNVAFLVLTFKPTSAEFLRDHQDAKMKRTWAENDNENWTHEKAFEQDIESETPKKGQVSRAPANKKSLLTTLKLPYQWSICLFALLYCGCETTTQSLMVSYLLGTRHAKPDTVGYVTSGFWGGITVGRCIWGHFMSSGNLWSKDAFIGLTMQILIWKINSNLANSFSTSIIGMVYGPIFPACLTLANDILPLEVRMVSMALVSATGSAGSALFPFIAGAISSSKGVQSLVYVTIPLASTITCIWFLFPSRIPSGAGAV